VYFVRIVFGLPEDYHHKYLFSICARSCHGVLNDCFSDENARVRRTAFGGGTRGTEAGTSASTAAAVAFRRGLAPVSAQPQHAQMARRDPVLHAAVNHGRPAIAATPRPGPFERREERGAERRTEEGRGEPHGRGEGK